MSRRLDEIEEKIVKSVRDVSGLREELSILKRTQICLADRIRRLEEVPPLPPILACCPSCGSPTLWLDGKAQRTCPKACQYA